MKKFMIILMLAPALTMTSCSGEETEEKPEESSDKRMTADDVPDEIEAYTLENLPEDEPFSLEHADPRPALRIWLAVEDQTEELMIDGMPASTEMICDALYEFYNGEMVPREMISEDIADQKVMKFQDLGDARYAANWKTAKEAAVKLGIFNRIRDGYIVEIGRDDNVKGVKYDEVRNQVEICYKDLRDQFALNHFNSLYEDLPTADKAAVRIAFPDRIVEKL